MRELKFRAWDKVEKKMLFDADPFALHVSGSNEPLLAKTHRNEDCIFEQYTGLKDKNGKEIYEGDIIDVSSVFVKPKKMIAKFSEMACGFEPFAIGCPDCYFPVGKDVEVIGNIHENPELIGGKEQ